MEKPNYGRGHTKLGSHNKNVHDPENSERLIACIRKTVHRCQYGIYSKTALARYCHVAPGTVKGWATNGYYPHESFDERIDRWCADPLGVLIECMLDARKKRSLRKTGITDELFQSVVEGAADFNRRDWQAIIRWTYPEWFAEIYDPYFKKS